MRSALASEQGDASAETIATLRLALTSFTAMNQMVRLPHYMGTLAEVLMKAGQLVEAEEAIGAALGHATAQSELWCMPELLRICASIFRARQCDRKAEADLIEAMRLADQIGALSWRLRAASDFARLRVSQSRSDEARAVLLPVYERFEEGFDTRDLRVAAEMLSSL